MWELHPFACLKGVHLPLWLFSTSGLLIEKNKKMENENKLKRVVFYINTNDKKLLFDQCGLLNVKPSFYVRNLVLEKLGKPIYQPPKMDFETEEYLRELMAIGNNLNQIARKLNSNEQFLIADQQDVLDTISTITKQILQIKSELK